MAEADPADDAWGREEVACALRLAPATVPARLHEASALCGRLPRTLAAVERGQLTLRHATVLAAAVEQRSDEIAAAVEDRVLTRGAAQTVPEFRRSVRRAVLDLDGRASEEKHRDAVADRRVIFTPVEDGMTELWALLPADGAALLQAALNRCAHRGARTAGAAAGERADADERTADQRRADALVDLARHDHTGDAAGDLARHDYAADTAGRDKAADAVGRDSAADAVGRDSAADAGSRDGDGRERAGQDAGDVGREDVARADTHSGGARYPTRPAVQVVVALSTLLGADDQPGVLAGHGPIPAALARHIAADPSGTWRRIVTDPMTGLVLDCARRAYRPPADLARFVVARDGVCTFPGCARTAARCDLDHRIPFTGGGTSGGGTTSADNLDALCRRHHRLKHRAGWTVRRTPDGVSHWHTTTGHRYRSRPPDLPEDRTGAGPPADDPGATPNTAAP